MQAFLQPSAQKLRTPPMGKLNGRGKNIPGKDRVYFCSSSLRCSFSQPSHLWKSQGALSHALHHMSFEGNSVQQRRHIFLSPFYSKVKSRPELLDFFNKATPVMGILEVQCTKSVCVYSPQAWPIFPSCWQPARPPPPPTLGSLFVIGHSEPASYGGKGHLIVTG